MKKTSLLPILLLLAIFASAQSSYPVIAHAHNDYQQKHPIETALNHGFTSLEVDIVYDGTNLVVSHDKINLAKKPHFENYYLKPLLEKLKSKQSPIILLVDIKNYSDEMLSKLNDILKRHEVNLVKRDEDPSNKKIQIILSGNIPRAKIIGEQSNEFLFIDGRIEDLEHAYSEQYMPMISMNFSKLCKWDGTKKPDRATIEKIHSLITSVHQKGKKLRFWRMPETELMWLTLIALQIDFIGVDGIENFHQKLTKHQLIKQ